MKVVKQLLILAASVGLLAGCATNGNNQGAPPKTVGMQSGTGQSPYYPSRLFPLSVQRPTGPNGSIGLGNPFGLGPGNTDNF